MFSIPIAVWYNNGMEKFLTMKFLAKPKTIQEMGYKRLEEFSIALWNCEPMFDGDETMIDYPWSDNG